VIKATAWAVVSAPACCVVSATTWLVSSAAIAAVLNVEKSGGVSIAAI
jgi:hypothetical protein